MKNKKQIEKLTVIAVLTAIEIILAFTPLGYLKIGLLSITFMTVPIIIGAVTEGFAASTILGFVFGMTSFLQCFGLDAFGTQLFSINPFGTFVMCVVTRTLMGFLCGLIYKGLNQKSKIKPLSIGISAFSAPFLNTLFFVPMLILFFWNSDYIQGLANGANVL